MLGLGELGHLGVQYAAKMCFDTVGIAREIAVGCKDAAFTGRLNKIGVDPVCSTPVEFEQAVRDDLVLWKEAVQAAGVKPQ